MQTKLIYSLLTFCLSLCNLLCIVSGVCETEEDLDFDSCDLKHLKDEVLKDICNRIGLDLETHVLPFLFDELGEGDEQTIEEGDKPARTYTHDDFVKGAEECLMIEEEMDQLEESDPEYLAQLEREALHDDPEMVAEILADVLKQDETLLKDIANKLLADAPETVKEMEGMLGEGEKLEDRADVVGFIVAKLLAEDENLHLIDELDEALSQHLYDWADDEDIGDGDEL